MVCRPSQAWMDLLGSHRICLQILQGQTVQQRSKVRTLRWASAAKVPQATYDCTAKLSWMMYCVLFIQDHDVIILVFLSKMTGNDSHHRECYGVLKSLMWSLSTLASDNFYVYLLHARFKHIIFNVYNLYNNIEFCLIHVLITEVLFQLYAFRVFCIHYACIHCILCIACIHYETITSTVMCLIGY